MEERKWENMSSDCLVNIFKRLDLDMLLHDVPFVCKNWYQALLDNPLCWQNLVFPRNASESGNYQSRFARFLQFGGANVSAALDFVLNRSRGLATTVVLPSFTNIEDVLYVIDKCPALRFLAVPSHTFVVDYEDILDPVSGDYSFDSLASLDEFAEECYKQMSARKCNYMIQIIDKIELHCKDFVGLSVENAEFSNEVTSAIVSKLATLKYLVIDHAILDKKHLEIILLGCIDLEMLHIRDSLSFDENAYDVFKVYDVYILKLASRIKDFRYGDFEESSLWPFCEESDLLPFPDYIVYDDC
ncbi:F-box/LRR-repeat protein At3g48880-like [Apium graveolens]|uniref:F-box/LRR-repeat protein At3g48880-like n=1 Tax=Apium graveolens TaxID=4045 RepID=UPI003D7BC745